MVIIISFEEEQSVDSSAIKLNFLPVTTLFSSSFNVGEITWRMIAVHLVRCNLDFSQDEPDPNSLMISPVVNTANTCM